MTFTFPPSAPPVTSAMALYNKALGPSTRPSASQQCFPVGPALTRALAPGSVLGRLSGPAPDLRGQNPHFTIGPGDSQVRSGLGCAAAPRRFLGRR